MVKEIGRRRIRNELTAADTFGDGFGLALCDTEDTSIAVTTALSYPGSEASRQPCRTRLKD